MLKHVLFNIKTDKKASKMVENYLLNIFSHGEKKQDNFVRECSSSSEKFMQPIWKTSVILPIEILDLFGRLLCLSATKKMLLDTVILYHLLTEPPYFTNLIGKWDKVINQQYFVTWNSLYSDPPSWVATTVTNSKFILRSNLCNLPPTLSTLAKRILAKTLKLSIPFVEQICISVYMKASA